MSILGGGSVNGIFGIPLRSFALLCEEFNAEFRAPSCEVQRRTSHSLVLTFSLEFALFTVKVHVESLWIPRGVHGVSADFGVNSVRSPHMEIWKSGIPAGFRIEKWNSSWVPHGKCGGCGFRNRSAEFQLENANSTSPPGLHAEKVGLRMGGGELDAELR